MRPLLFIATLVGLSHAALAQSPIAYTVSFPDAHAHYVDIKASLPTDGRSQIDVMMAVWTPGSYLVREYARHVEGITAMDGNGRVLPVRKIRKNRWRIDQTAGDSVVHFRYRLYGREMTVRTNWIDAEMALLNGAPTFITLADEMSPRPHDLQLSLPEAWRSVQTALPGHPDGAKHHFRAPDFDTLVDAPILIGNPHVEQFEAGGALHLLVDQGGANIWDSARAAADVAKLVTTQQAFWGKVPYSRYVFLNLLVEKGGGLEHKDSTVLMTSRWGQGVRKSYLGWLGLVSHEFFHTWNVKRLRPVELGPFDYEAENHTRALWIAEGVTSYYDDLLVHRSGLSTRKEYLERLSKGIDRLQKTPGRLVRSLEDASYDAWIKYYRPDENSINTNISYYTKGLVISFLLDAEIRRVTSGKRNLDEVMRAAYARYSGTQGYPLDGFYALVSEIAGADLRPWFANHAASTEELDYGPALEWYGLEFKPPKAPKKGPTADPTPGWLGAKMKGSVVRTVPRETPAYAAGLNVDDELLGIDGHRVSAGKLDERLKRYRPGTQVDLLITRRGQIRALTVVLAEAPKDRWKLQIKTKATKKQKAHLAAWLQSVNAPEPEKKPKKKRGKR